MSPWRAALLGALTYGVPVAVWLVGSLGPAASPPDLAAAHAVFLWAQVLALTVLQPALADQSLVRQLGASLALLWLPAPLLVLIALTGSVPTPDLARGQGLTTAAAVALALFWHAGARLAPTWRRTCLSGAQALALLALVLGLEMRRGGGWP